MIGINKDTLCAVIVTFHPTLAELHAGIQAVWNQVGQVLLVDNSPTDDNDAVTGYADLPVAKLMLGENLGVASAQNRGIEWAKEHGFSHVLLMDQDSVASDDMVEKLGQALGELTRKGIRVAAVGPALHDGRDGTPVHFAVRRHVLMGRYFGAGDEVVEVEYLISSGSLIPLASIATIGLLEDGLFIEYVDIEWCLRAKAKGYSCYGVCGAVLNHNMGDTAITSPWLLGRRFQIYTPFRFYYQFRNAISLCRRRYVPLYVSLHIFVIHMCVRFALSMLILPSKMRIITMVTMGIWHGVTGKSGPLFPPPLAGLSSVPP